jgi:hypothetical protein
MKSQHEQLPQHERDEYVAPAGQVLGTVKELTALTGVCNFPSCRTY